MIKKFIKSITNSLGFDIIRTGKKHLPDLELYQKLYPQDTLEKKLFYNVGSGSFYHPYWTNLDYVSDWYKGVQKDVVHIDLMELKPLPLPENTAEVVYTSHTIEHISDDAVKNLFKETYKALKPGGYFRVTTGPDADTDYAALSRGDADWFYWNKWYDQPGTYEQILHQPASSVPLEERWLHHVASQLAPNDISPSNVKLTAAEIKALMIQKPKEELLNYLTSLCQFQPERTGNHISWWNASKIESYLREAGFTNVYKSGYGQSNCPVLRNVTYFDNTHPQISVYVEAVK